MKRIVAIASLLAVVGTTGACTQFQTSRETLTPAAPSPLPDGSSTGTLVGPWATSETSFPTPTSCKDFTWTITSQSPTAVTGTFSAECGSGLTVTAAASGTLTSPTTGTITVTGSGIVDGLGCQFTLTSDNVTIASDSITIPYTGTTCFGPVSGTEVLRRPAPKAPEPPPSTTPDPIPPVESPFHVGPGPLSVARAQQVVAATGEEWASLRGPRGSTDEKLGATEELLLRVIWHLKLAGFQAARQRNPSTAISLDKFTVFADGGWHAYDIFTNFDFPDRETRMLFLEVGSPNPVAVDGIPD